ncbi:MAG: hypothetical protein PS018_27390 [bacterium]|nr:hypothetical protein [bacterium]
MKRSVTRDSIACGTTDPGLRFAPQDGDNEQKASACLEIRVCFELPHLREIAFAHRRHEAEFAKTTS